MTYRLHLGNRLYFSWSLSAWLMLNRFDTGTSVETIYHRPESEGGVGALIADLAPARTLPTLVTTDGAVLSDSMAIAEELASRHPEVPYWPADHALRGLARTLACEMHSSFGTLRGSYPFNLRHAFTGVVPTEAAARELDRLETIWSQARVTAGDGPWLLGAYSLADAIFAPMALRLATYGFDTRPTTQAYVAAHLADPAIRRWRAMGLANEPVMAGSESDAPRRPWPGPAPLAARTAAAGPSVNATCPYSGDPVAHFLEIGDRVFGFCNAFCRDKTLNDPEAWPRFIAIYQS